MQSRRRDFNRLAVLFAVACCRKVWRILRDRRSREAVEAAERFADDADRLDWEELRQARARADQALDDLARERGYRAADVVRAWPAYLRWAHVAAWVAHDDGSVGAFTMHYVTRAKEQAVLCPLLREIAGNPFRLVPFDPGWRTPTVAALAAGTWEKRQLPSGHLEAARLAVLCDALEEAGCDSADLLGHLRCPGPHVRGCWPLDLLLGKETTL